ncbi:MAG: sigma-70 family RNA polymerase sigma factor [Hamadaea sp.]|uniref:RNA polymerase sigma factor n=1 Tax=Hamadaea sp. TaxID=2024425 RepID=UPI0017C0FD69|nr:sigma-70 family RNA polymerase sigma factor [Hamadaea sp.]NUR70269.1 sigma-70 family RNA polymerase sigma factor [Hamadaea sp.]NUT18355.1 sigma-70 family RNA polymerase sigma factor [Hamadaea sp.]
MTRFATRRVGADAAGDIVAQTFLIAWRRFAELPPDHARAWLYSTARQVVANELRGRTRRERLAAKAASGSDAEVADHAGQVDERLRVRAVLAQLSPADAEVLRLVEWEGLDVAEAALVLRCTRTALKVRLHRARKRFAQRLLAAEEQDTTAIRRTRPTIVPGGSTTS